MTLDDDEAASVGAVRVLVIALLFALPGFAAGADAKNDAKNDAVVDDEAGVDPAVAAVDDPGAPAPVAVTPPPPIDASEHLPPASSASEMFVPFLKTMLMLGVVLILVWLTLSKGMGKLVEKAQAGKRVRVIERISLDARRSLFLVDVDGKQILIGGGDVVRLGDVDVDNVAKKAERQSIFDKVIRGGGTVITETQPTTTDSTSEPA